MLSSNLFLLIGFHLVLTIVYSFAILIKRSSLSPAMILLILCVPLFGPLAALIADLVNNFRNEFAPPGPIEMVELEEDIYWKSIRKQANSENIVPLEEALIINDRQTRKKLVLEMLLDDPMKNIDILLLARENNDVDTAHYANTTIAKIQRDFQLQVQELAANHESDPSNTAVLDKYIDTLGKFIESGLSEAYLLRRQRILYGSLLDKKIELEGWSQETLQKKINNALSLKEINTAVKTNQILHENFPDDENTWINELQISIAGHDASHLKKTLITIKQKKIDWSREGREKLTVWMQVES